MSSKLKFLYQAIFTIVHGDIIIQIQGSFMGMYFPLVSCV